MSGIACKICPHSCYLLPGEIGKCGARQGQINRVVPINYGECTAIALDPIEKKPLARFDPGKQILSYGSFGCNLTCAFCQNWEISQMGKEFQGAESPREATRRKVKSYPLSPKELTEQAAELKERGNIGVALTYNEPLICPEYIMDVAELMHAQDLKLVLVTNGYVMASVAEQVFEVVDAANIDLKSFHQDFYTDVGAPAGLATVKQTIEIAHRAGCHVEVTTLLIPRLNDYKEEMREEFAWLASLDPEIPLHLSAFHPAYKMRDREATSPSLVREFALIAQEKLKYVYLGNV